MGYKKTSENLAIKYLGRALLTTIIVMAFTIIAVLGYNVYVSVSVSKEKIEVQATNSNSVLLNDTK